MLFCIRLILSITLFVKLRHIVSHESSHFACKCFRNDSGSVIRVVNFTNDKEFIVTKSLRTIHHDDEVTSLLNDKGIELLIVVLREVEKNVGAIASITLNTEDRNSLNSLNLNVPFNYERINAFIAILSLTFGINILKCFSKMCNCVLIVQSRDQTKSGRFNLSCYRIGSLSYTSYTLPSYMFRLYHH